MCIHTYTLQHNILPITAMRVCHNDICQTRSSSCSLQVQHDTVSYCEKSAACGNRWHCSWNVTIYYHTFHRLTVSWLPSVPLTDTLWKQPCKLTFQNWGHYIAVHWEQIEQMENWETVFKIDTKKKNVFQRVKNSLRTELFMLLWWKVLVNGKHIKMAVYVLTHTRKFWRWLSLMAYTVSLNMMATTANPIHSVSSFPEQYPLNPSISSTEPTQSHHFQYSTHSIPSLDRKSVV
jgi:hypothetical protein